MISDKDGYTRSCLVDFARGGRITRCCVIAAFMLTTGACGEGGALKDSELGSPNREPAVKPQQPEMTRNPGAVGRIPLPLLKVDTIKVFTDERSDESLFRGAIAEQKRAFAAQGIEIRFSGISQKLTKCLDENVLHVSFSTSRPDEMTLSRCVKGLYLDTPLSSTDLKTELEGFLTTTLAMYRAIKSDPSTLATY